MNKEKQWPYSHIRFERGSKKWITFDEAALVLGSFESEALALAAVEQRAKELENDEPRS